MYFIFSCAYYKHCRVSEVNLILVRKPNICSLLADGGELLLHNSPSEAKSLLSLCVQTLYYTKLELQDCVSTRPDSLHSCYKERLCGVPCVVYIRHVFGIGKPYDMILNIRGTTPEELQLIITSDTP